MRTLCSMLAAASLIFSAITTESLANNAEGPTSTYLTFLSCVTGGTRDARCCSILTTGQKESENLCIQGASLKRKDRMMFYFYCLHTPAEKCTEHLTEELKSALGAK